MTWCVQSGITTTLALVAHELPHEISDFTILLRSGFSFRETIAAQILTGFGTLFGTATAPTLKLLLLLFFCFWLMLSVHFTCSYILILRFRL